MCVHERQRVSMANGHALAKGVRLGMSTTQARALLPDIHCLLRDPKQEHALLNALQETLYQITPHIQLLHLPGQGYAEHAIALEISDCLHLFGGWLPLLQLIRESLSPLLLAMHYKLAVAHSPTAAWLLTWQTSSNVLHKPTQEAIQKQLLSLSIQHLLHYPKIISQLDSMGFATLGDLFRHIERPSNQFDYSGLQKRFGKSFVDYLHSIFDTNRPTVRPWFNEKIEFFDNIEFDYPLNNWEWLLPCMEDLLRKLSSFLQKNQKKTQLIIWRLSDITHNNESLIVRTHKPTSDWNILLELSKIHFSQKALPFSVDSVELRCRQLLNKELTTVDLFQDSKIPGENSEREKLSTKLNARLGEHATYRLSRLDAHLPELTQEKVALQTPERELDIPLSALRPTWLFDPPTPIQPKANGLFWHGYLKLLQGPERITGQWWVKPEERDYFLAIRDDFVRLWLFYERIQRQWYVQGVF